MASRRNLKKNISFVTSEVMSECYAFMLLNNGKKNDETEDVMEEAYMSHLKLLQAVNEGRNVPKSERKKYYREIANGLNNLWEEGISKLDKLEE